MKFQIILKDGQVHSVSDEDSLQLMIITGQIHSFKRSDSWVVIAKDKIRLGFSSF